MLRQRCTRMIFKQIFEQESVYRPLQVNVTRSFYDNYEAINHFIKYLRKRQITVGTKAEAYGRHVYGPPLGMIVKVNAPDLHDFVTLRLRCWWKRQKENYQKYIEKEQYKKYIIAGPNLAAAKYVIECSGKIRFKNHDEWIDKTKKSELSKFPNEYDENFILEEIDFNGYPIPYEHLDFIFNLFDLRTLSFRGCRTINDWSLDKLAAEFPNLEHLDVSECENVTERGLEALYRMPNLKKLTVTNFYGTAAFDLTCLLLEDVNPYLKCQIQQPKYKSLPKK
ncbi:distal membrane-arm assembly complex protein 2 [Bombus pascuorum]|uniref:distal membrane-arm assembly complex protein 2 n=1 Tax=Bombus pascuorum TaxID=65598 RepID=UPI00298D89B0|nr:distal membrane-arm assembly complex protein 2 [Bombus pascuorum]